MLSEADKVRVGSLTTTDLEIGDHNKTPLANHVAEYIADLKTRGVNADRIKTSETRLNAACNGCGFRWLRDLKAETSADLQDADLDRIANQRATDVASW
ncbi:hypothetical protein RE6C_04414 [Rhodopirellula europaea 6C]|uniref:Uncharacterized protein n=1 Tax=Rhodopirellula europaea 6C TaxID=1263867 RepID=M2A4T8_9BACT|nr:hypothetical protein RE6C_04414 [Rhodopirellula europaea 6C]